MNEENNDIKIKLTFLDWLTLPFKGFKIVIKKDYMEILLGLGDGIIDPEIFGIIEEEKK